MEELNTNYQNHSGVFVPLSLVIDKRIADLVMLKISIRIRIRSSRKNRIQPPSKEPTLEKPDSDSTLFLPNKIDLLLILSPIRSTSKTPGSG